MAILPIELEPLNSLPDPSQHNRALVLYRGDFCYAYNNKWYRVLANRQAMGRFILTGYVFGGRLSGFFQNTIRSLVFPSETYTTIATQMLVARQGYMCVHSETRAYPGGGYSGSHATQIQVFRFYGESIASLSAVLSLARDAGTPLRNTTAGYYAGGSPSTTRIDKLLYSNESCAALSAVLSAARYWSGGVRSSQYGYACGGTGSNTRVDRLVFSNDTCAQALFSLSVGRESPDSATSITHGYILGGSSLTTFNIIPYSNETITTGSTTFSAGVGYGAVYSYEKAYVCGKLANNVFEGLLFSTNTVFVSAITVATNTGYCCVSSCQTGGIL